MEGWNPPVGEDRSQDLPHLRRKEGPSSEGRLEPEGLERMDGPYRKGTWIPPSLEERGGGGHTSMDPRIGAGKKREEGWNLPHPKQDECPPFEQGGGKPGLLCALCSFVPPKATIYSGSMHPVPKHAEEDHGSLSTVPSPSFRIVSHPPSVGLDHLVSKDGSQTSRPRCSLVHKFGVDFWTR